jgi:hypothetical protein
MTVREKSEYMKFLKETDISLYKEHFKKSKNGINESINIQLLIDHLNNLSPIGLSIINKLKENLDIIFKKAIIRKMGNRKCHYDFIIVDNNDVEHKVEHKGSYKYKKIEADDKPWKSGVQFGNLGCDKFEELTRVYALIWYKEYIESNYLKDEYKISAIIPTFNTWYRSDCCTQGNPKTLFGKELKQNYRKEYGHTSPLHLRNKVNSIFLEKVRKDFSLLERFQTNVYDIAKKLLDEKDIWIQINGDLKTNNVCFRVYGKQEIKNPLSNIKCITKSDIDLVFDDNLLKIKAKLRWGKGAGFSNLRVDLK